MKLLAPIIFGFFVGIAHSAEYIEFDSFDDNRQVTTKVLAEVHYPAITNSKLPVIITQHGSSPTVRFENGKGSTDIFSKKVIEQGVRNGFVVIAVDAFYQRNLNSNTKTQFPSAHIYANQLKNIVSADPRIDPTRIFYTGWSYGGLMGIYLTSGQYRDEPVQWRAIAPTEAGCQFQPKAQKVSYPVLLVLGETSHYPPKPCVMFSQKLKEVGTVSETIVMPNASHSFSSYGDRRGSSLTLNGCTDNPITTSKHGLTRADGTSLTKEQANRECQTWSGEGGGPGDQMDKAVQHVVTFFNRYK